MPRQISPIVKLEGNIDGLSFFKSQDGYMAKEKSGVKGDRIKNDAAFKNTRRNYAEFGMACKAGKQFRLAFVDEITKASDNRVISRVSKNMLAVAKTDPVSAWGERRVQNGNCKLLEGLEFNIAAPLTAAFKKEYTWSFNRVTGSASINLPDFKPEASIAAPDGVSHYRFFAAAGTIDFELKDANVFRAELPFRPYDNVLASLGSLQMILPPNSTLPVFILLGIEFTILVNGEEYEQAKKLNSLSLVAVDMPA